MIHRSTSLAQTLLVGSLGAFVTTRAASEARGSSSGLLVAAAAQSSEVQPLEFHAGEPLDPAFYGPGVIETMEVALERERLRVLEQGDAPPSREPMPGAWVVPTQRSVSAPHSGELNIFNARGDLSMGIGFPGPVDLAGAWVGGQSDEGVWPPALRVIGYRDGIESGSTEWFSSIGAEPVWFPIDLAKVDRVVFEAQPAIGNAAWYTLDDITYSYAVEGPPGEPARTRTVVLDFEDCEWRQQLTGSRYAGLAWESGTGYARDTGVHAPERGPRLSSAPPADEPFPPAGGSGTLPDLLSDFEGIKRNDHSSSTYPPDTCGSVGPTQFVEVINRVFAVYDKSNGAKLLGMNLGSFLPGSNGDPRVHFDPHSGRWIVTVTDFNTRVYLAVSLTGNATGSWFKTNFTVSAGSDAGCWPDYPTMGVDANGVYVSAFMVNCGTMTIWAINKAPLVGPTPSLGTVTAFRNLPYDQALQPCLTYGNPAGEYVVSTNGSSQIRVRRVNPPLTNPTLTSLANISVGTWTDPPTAPAQGSTPNIDTIDSRLMNAVYRDGSIWCGHNVSQSSRASCRWYELDASSFAMLQKGTIADGLLHYYFPGITVNADGNVAVGFSGSHAGQFVGAYYTGRKATDPPNEMAIPVQFRAGQAAQNNIDGAGFNRWGDYSLSSVDPVDDRTMWTIQEYAHATNIWGTQVAEIAFATAGCPDPTTYCISAPNSVGSGMLMNFTGSASVSAQDLELIAVAGPPNQLGIFYYGPQQVQIPFGNGFRCVDAGAFGTFRLPVVQLDLLGDVTYPIDWSQPPVCCGAGMIVDGDTWNFQFWYRDPAAGGFNFNFSDALEIVFCP